MNWGRVRVLVVHELRMLLRDRRTVLLSVILPVVVFPLVLYSTKFTRQKRREALETTTYSYAVTGTWSAEVRRIVATAQQLAAQVPPRTTGETAERKDLQLVEVNVEDAAASLQARQVLFYLEGMTGDEADADAKASATSAEKEKARARRRPPPGQDSDRGPARLAGVPLVRIHFLAGRDASQASRTRVRDLLLGARRAAADGLLRERGFPVRADDVFKVEDRNLATPSEVTGASVGRYLTIFLVMLLLTGGAAAAMDIIAGEKERGTLETLLTTAVLRSEIVAAKQLTILSVAIFIALVQVANMLVYLTLRVIELPSDFSLDLPPGSLLALALLLLLPLAALLASLLLMISGYAKSYKEAQLYFFPLYLLSLVPAMAGALPGVPLRSAIVLVPLANVSVAVREVMVGRHDWPMLLVVCGVMSLAAAAVVRASARMLSSERLIMASQADGASLDRPGGAFPEHVLLWYGVLWVVLFSVALNVPLLQTLRRQILFNQLVVFLGGSLLMIWKYRLHFREAWALRPVKPVVWLAVLLAIPSGHITAIGVFRLASLVVPVPPQVLEQFSQALLPEDIPTWQLFVLLAVVPGIFEEVAFRGTLLYGLHRRFHPAALVIGVGAIFGLFHVELFRIAPTGFLGMILTAIALLTGSILPGMLVHAGNNAFAIWTGTAGFPLGNLDPWLYAAATVVFALALFLVYRNRTPYPGLRPWPGRRMSEGRA